MKKILFILFSSVLLQACTDNNKTGNSTPPTASIQEAPQVDTTQTATAAATSWNGSSLSDATIKQVQQDKYAYSQCVYKEAQKKGYTKIDSRAATDAIIKQCEADLAKIRETFINEGVPEIVADRYLKKTRVQLTRKILQSLMFAQAARTAGATQ